PGGPRPRHPGPRRPGADRRHPSRLLVAPRAGGPHLRRAGRGAQDERRPPHPPGLRDGEEAVSEGSGGLDAPRPVRPGEEIDARRLAAWLADHLPAPAAGAPLSVEQFPGGHSNLTYLVRWGERELVLRRPPVGSRVKTAHDMGREYRVLSRLPDLYPRAPLALAACDDPAVLGAPFYVMERVRGVILRGPAPPPGVDLPPERMRRLSEAVVDGLAELHAVDVSRAGLADFGRPEGYVQRQVAGWSE